MDDTGKLQSLTDGLAHIQLVKFCQNTRTQYMSANGVCLAQLLRLTLVPGEHIALGLVYEF
jgi:hypothetical protein